MNREYFTRISESGESKAGEFNVRIEEGERRGSVYTPAMQAVFEYGDWRSCETDPERSGVRFASELGFIVTKAQATTSKRRLRDLFDIFLTVRASKDADDLCKRWQAELNRGSRRVRAAQEFLREAVNRPEPLEYAARLLQGSAVSHVQAEDVLQVLRPLL